MKLSARNQLKGTVSAITEGAVEAVVKIDVGGQTITSVITLEAVRDLGLAVGSPAVAIIKADAVVIGVD
ncbi:MAG: TOBE domain-containing protein [Coriobacteriales bacterium]|nr:TOBE domain-containing protein [Coriobacteriales bacterium]